MKRDRFAAPVGYFGDVDLSDIESVVQHPHVQRLGGIMQLGLDHLIFRGARHTRLEHSIAVAGLARRSVRHLARHGFDLAWAKPMLVYGLLHDLGHLPFGHLMEFEMGIDLDLNTIDLLDRPCPRGGPTVREVMHAAGIDDKIVEALMAHTLPEHAIVKDRNIGADKLGYVIMDNHYTGCWSHPPDLDALLGALRYKDGLFGVAEEGAPILADIMRLYIDLRLHVYGHPGCTTLERMLQKAVEAALRAGEFTTENILGMDDADLESGLRYSWNDEARELALRIRYGEVPPVAAMFQYGKRTGLIEPDAPVRQVPLSFLQKFYQASRNPHDLTRIESRIADELRISSLDVYLPQPPNLAKTYPKDTPIIGSSGAAGSVFEMYPRLKATLKRKVNFGVKVYVYAARPYDKVVCGKADLVHEILDEELGKFSEEEPA